MKGESVARQWGLDLARTRPGWGRWDRWRWRSGLSGPYKAQWPDMPCPQKLLFPDWPCDGTPGAPGVPGGPEVEDLAESLGVPAAGGIGCPSVLGLKAWEGLDGLSITLLSNDGAPLGAGPKFRFWVGGGRIYQFWVITPGVDILNRWCVSVATLSEQQALVVKLNGLTTGQLEGLGYG